MEYKVITTIEYEMTVEPPELPLTVTGEGVDDIRGHLGDVINEILTEQANCIWVDTANERINDLPKEDDIKSAMRDELQEIYDIKVGDTIEDGEPFQLSTHWLNEAFDCIDNWMLDDSLTHDNEECTIEEGY
jgi:hypothetical protein